MKDNARPPMFAAKFICLLSRSATAQELGPNVCWLLTVIVGQEDAPSVRYCRPVTYYFDQLMPLCGFRSPKQLRAAITTAVAAGWLEYTPGAKARPGRFRVKVPDDLVDMESRGCDESGASVFVSESEMNHDRDGECVSESEVKREGKRKPIGHQSGNEKVTLPNPVPIPKEGAASGEAPSGVKTGKAKSPKFDPLSIEIPDSLRSTRFRSAWRDWCQHRREIRKPLTPTATGQQIKTLVGWGEQRAVAAIEHTVAMGWTGLWEPEGASTRNGSPSGSAPKRAKPMRTREQIEAEDAIR